MKCYSILHVFLYSTPALGTRSTTSIRSQRKAKELQVYLTALFFQTQQSFFYHLKHSRNYTIRILHENFYN